MHVTELGAILTLDDLWRVTGLKKTQVQNWTNGRPFKVCGAIAQAVGTGFRNLYVEEDAYLLVFLKELQDLGVNIPSLQRVVDFFNVRSVGERPRAVEYFCPQHAWLLVSLTKHALHVGSLPTLKQPPNPRLTPPLQLNDFHDRGGHQLAVNIAKIRAEVDERLERIARAKETPTQHSKTSRANGRKAHERTSK